MFRGLLDGDGRGMIVHRDLPIELTPLFGRDEELDDLARLVSANRAVTLWGVGGCGKTRLALRLARRQAHEFSDGAIWVDLGAIRDARLIPEHIAAAAGAGPLSSTQPLDTLVEALADRQMLLVLDNCEHLVVTCRKVVTALLASGTRARVVATSRQPLAVPGEVVFRVDPLPVPDATDVSSKDITNAAAVQLFIDRATRVHRDFTVDDANAAAVAGICRDLEGLPLAIELAAARAHALSPRQIEEGLHDRFRLLRSDDGTAPDRLRTLAGSVEWSVDLLSKSERTVLAALCLLPGTFDLSTAAAVVADDCNGADILQIVQRLVDRSLIQVRTDTDPFRYAMLETIRVYVRHHCDPDPAKVRGRLIDHVVTEIGRPGHRARGDQPPDPVRSVVDALDMVRAALDWAAEDGRWDAVLKIIADHQPVWWAADLCTEMLGRLQFVRARPGVEDAHRCRIDTVSAILAGGSGEPRLAEPLAVGAVEAARRVGDSALLGAALAHRVSASMQALSTSGEELLAMAAEAQQHAQAAGDRTTEWWAAAQQRTLKFLRLEAGEEDLHAPDGLAASAGGALIEAMSLGLGAVCLASASRFTEATDAATRAAELAAGKLTGVPLAAIHEVLADCEMQRGRYESAAHHLDQADLHYRSGGGRGWRLGSINRAEFRYRTGSSDEARTLAERWLRVSEDSGMGIHFVPTSTLLGWLDLDAGRLDDARTRFGCARDRSHVIPSNTLVGYAELGLAYTAIGGADFDQAWLHAQRSLSSFGATTGLSDEVGLALVLEVLGELAVEFGDGRAALDRLLAARQLIGEHGYCRRPVEDAQRRRTEAAVQRALGAERIDARSQLRDEACVDDVIRAAIDSRHGRGAATGSWLGLTPAEAEVARLISSGMTNREIAEALFVSTNTVKTHLRHVFAKLGVRSRAAVAREVTKRGD